MKSFAKKIFVAIWLIIVACATSVIVNRVNRSGLRPISETETKTFLARFHPSSPLIVEVMDFECPACRIVYPDVADWQKKRSDVRCEFVHFPLKIHQKAMSVAVATEVARSKGRFERMTDDLMSGRLEANDKAIKKYLSEIDPLLSNDPNLNEKAKSHVIADVQFCEEMKVSKTPTIFAWNGNRLFEITSIKGLDQFLN